MDVAIIGGGITGISTADQLKDSGFATTVLVSGKIRYGTIGQSTGNFYINIEELLVSLKEKYDEDVIHKVIQARKKAFDVIESNVRDYQINRDFNIQPIFIFGEESSSSLNISDELELDKKLNISAFEIQRQAPFYLPIPEYEPAQFNPLLYTQGLALEVQERNTCTIYERTRVHSIKKVNDYFAI